jgi:hypothetical protein
MSSFHSIVLQKSKVVSVGIFGENLKREETDDSHGVRRVTEVAYEFSVRRRGPSGSYTKTTPTARRSFTHLYKTTFATVNLATAIAGKKEPGEGAGLQYGAAIHRAPCIRREEAGSLASTPLNLRRHLQLALRVPKASRCGSLNYRCSGNFRDIFDLSALRLRVAVNNLPISLGRSAECRALVGGWPSFSRLSFLTMTNSQLGT